MTPHKPTFLRLLIRVDRALNWALGKKPGCEGYYFGYYFGVTTASIVIWGLWGHFHV